MIKVKRADDVWLLYRGSKHFLKGYSELSRGGTLSPSDFVYFLENGIRIVSAHFKFGLAKFPIAQWAWHMRLFYPKSLLSELLYAENPLLQTVTKKDIWQGATVRAFYHD